MRLPAASLALAALASLAGCPKPRTAAATQPTPAAFDAAASDPKALATADAGLAALGGYDKWANLKELTFETKYTLNGELKLYAIDKWDRWNGRHNSQDIDIATMKSGNPADVKVREVRYDLFDPNKKPFATYDGKPIMRDDADRAAQAAKKHLQTEGYLFTLVYRVRDPGVKLESGGENKIEGACDPSCQTIKVTYDPAVGKDTWYINYNATTKLPEVIEQEIPGKGRIGYKIEGWTDAGGLKWPTKLQNLGMKGEVFEFGKVAVGEPDDNDYMHNVNE